MPEGSPFGPGIKAAVACLHGCQMVGLRRLTELCEGLFGLTLSQGAISNMLLRTGQPFGAAPQQIADAHQFCLAHLIRDAQYAIDHGDTIFAPKFKAFLKDACAVGRRRPDLADSTITMHRRRLDRELDRLLDLKPTDVEGSHLRATIAVTASDKLLVFLTRRDIAATNNESERALRPR
jgi:hypothetical protein